MNRSTATASASDCNFATSRWWNQGSESCCRLPDWIVNLPHLDKRGQPSLWIRPAISTTVTKNGRRRRSSAIDEQKFFDRYSLLVARPPLVNLFIIHWAISSLNFRLIGSSFNSYTLRTPKWSKVRGGVAPSFLLRRLLHHLLGSRQNRYVSQLKFVQVILGELIFLPPLGSAAHAATRLCLSFTHSSQVVRLLWSKK